MSPQKKRSHERTATRSLTSTWSAVTFKPLCSSVFTPCTDTVLNEFVKNKTNASVSFSEVMPASARSCKTTCRIIRMGTFDPFTLSIGRTSKQSRSNNENASAGANAGNGMLDASGSSSHTVPWAERCLATKATRAHETMRSSYNVPAKSGRRAASKDDHRRDGRSNP